MVGVLAFGLSFSFVFTSSLGLISVFVGFVFTCEDTGREWGVAYLVSRPPSLLSLTWGEARGDDGGGDGERGM